MLPREQGKQKLSADCVHAYAPVRAEQSREAVVTPTALLFGSCNCLHGQSQRSESSSSFTVHSVFPAPWQAPQLMLVFCWSQGMEMPQGAPWWAQPTSPASTVSPCLAVDSEACRHCPELMESQPCLGEASGGTAHIHGHREQSVARGSPGVLVRGAAPTPTLPEMAPQSFLPVPGHRGEIFRASRLSEMLTAMLSLTMTCGVNSYLCLQVPRGCAVS